MPNTFTGTIVSFEDGLKREWQAFVDEGRTSLTFEEYKGDESCLRVRFNDPTASNPQYSACWMGALIKPEDLDKVSVGQEVSGIFDISSDHRPTVIEFHDAPMRGYIIKLCSNIFRSKRFLSSVLF